MNRSNILSLPQENSLESILLDPSLGTVSTQTRKTPGVVKEGLNGQTKGQDYMEMVTEWAIWRNRKGADGRESQSVLTQPWH